MNSVFIFLTVGGYLRVVDGFRAIVQASASVTSANGSASVRHVYCGRGHHAMKPGWPSLLRKSPSRAAVKHGCLLNTKETRNTVRKAGEVDTLRVFERNMSFSLRLNIH